LWREFAAEAARIYKNRAAENVNYHSIAKFLGEIGEKEAQFFRDLEKIV